MTGSGIYEIRHVKSGKRYIGSAQNFHKRWIAHRNHLIRGTHHSPHLQRSWAKNGAQAFEFLVLEACHPDHLLLLEQVWMDWFNPEFNVCPKANSTAGRRFSDETKAKISAANTGKKHPVRTIEHREKLSAAHKGKPKPQHVVDALQAGRQAYVPTAESLKKRGESLRRAYESGLRTREKSDDHKVKIGRAVAKLSDEEVREVKRLSADGVTGRKLAVRFGVPTSTISLLLNGKTYRWVE
jgi:group I intron endonuclease